MYRPNTDFKPALAQSLWQLRQKTKNESDPTCTNLPTESVEEQLDQVELLNDLNSYAYTHINSYTPRHSKDEFNLAEFNIDQQIGELEPKQWEAICLLTRSASERKGVSKVTDPTLASFHTKKVRQFAIFCIMMFCINENYTISLHTLITDLIDGQGGSATLIKMLNHLGLCAFADTLACYIQHKSINKETGMNCCLNIDSFTVVSADHIDFLHSYAWVYKGSKNSSWYGLSIQADQPLPSLSIESETDHIFSKDVYLSYMSLLQVHKSSSCIL